MENETSRVKNFYKEYTRVVKSCLRPTHQVCLITILEEMHFIDERITSDPGFKLYHLVDRFREEFLVYSRSGEYTGEAEDIIKNLFKVLCGIMNLKLHQRGHNQLSEELLRTYAEAIKFYEDEPDYTTMDMLHTIKNLINRKAFSLSETQLEYLHNKFRDFFYNRQSWYEANQPDTQVQMASYQPKQAPTLHPPVQPYRNYPRRQESADSGPRQGGSGLNESSLLRNQVKPSYQPRRATESSLLEQQNYSYKPVRRASRQSRQSMGTNTPSQQPFNQNSASKSPMRLESKPVTQLSQQPIPPYERKQAEQRER